MAVPLHKRVKRRARSALLRAAIFVLSFLPLRAALALGAAIGRLAWWVAPRERRRMLAHLAVAFPEKGDAERRALARESLLALVTQPNAVIAKRSADEKLNALVERFRAEGGNRTLWRDDPGTGRELIRLFRQGGALGILIDQDTRVQGVFVPFFGRLAYTPRAVGDLALRFGATVVVGTSRRRGPRPGDGHELEMVELE